MQALESVRVRDCACPGTPHKDGDFVYISPTLPMEGGLVAVDQATARAKEVASGKKNNLENDWLVTFVRYGARGWNFVDAEGDDIPFDVEAVLDDFSIARLVAEKANDLGYGDAAIAPFLSRNNPGKPRADGKKRSRPSRNGRTPATTSQVLTPTDALSG